jgi:membrane-bound metal-dependent hydrolase YbcI (DUF457 family)
VAPWAWAAAVCGSLSIGAANLQEHASGLGWAVLDAILHGALGGLAMVVVWPAWGFRPVLGAIAAAVLIDLDHLVAAGSLDIVRIMSLAARPVAHSLVSLALISAGVGLVAGRRVGYGVAVGLLTHLWRDATEAPGIPLLVPLVADEHVMLPAWALPTTLVGLVLINTALVLGHRGRLGYPNAV